MQTHKSSQHDLTIKYQAFAEAVVRKLMGALSLPYENHDEYVSAGLLGLVEASERFNPNNGSDFRAFAFLRIRGAVIDSIRSNSELSGRAYRYAKALNAAHLLREEDSNRNTQQPVVPTAEANKERFSKILELASNGALALRLSFEDAEQEILNAREDVTGEDHLITKESRSGFRKLVKKLPPKERLIVEEFYFKEKSFSQIVDENEGFSKSWVSRLHRRALQRLKELYETAEKEL